MSLTAVIVGFENSNIADVERALSIELGIDRFPFQALGIHISAIDNKLEYLKADELLKKQGLEESNSFLRTFDILPFSTELHFECSRARLIRPLLEHLADIVAMNISRNLNTRALVRINDGEVPFRLYSRGLLEADYIDWYSFVFGEKTWIPVSRAARKD